MVEPPCCGDALRLTIEKFKFFVFCFKKIFLSRLTAEGGKEREREREKEKKREKRGIRNRLNKIYFLSPFFFF